MQILGGIFVGGAGSRFGGAAKGLLPAPSGGTILEHLIELMRAAEVEPILVGERAEYTDLARREGLTILSDHAALGPLGGLLSLYALGRRAIVVACDMPFLTTLAPLLASNAALAAPKRDGRWEPFYSVHDPRIGAIAQRHADAGKLSLQALFDAVPATELAVNPRELDDWDTPEDQSATMAGRTMPIRTMSK